MTEPPMLPFQVTDSTSDDHHWLSVRRDQIKVKIRIKSKNSEVRFSNRVKE